MHADVTTLPIVHYPYCCGYREEPSWMGKFFLGPFWTFLSHIKPLWIFRSFPTETSWAERSEMCAMRVFLGPTQLSLQASWVLGGAVFCTVSPASLQAGVRWVRVEWWDTLQRGRLTLSLEDPRREKEGLSSGRVQTPPTMGKLHSSHARANILPLTALPKRKERDAPNGDF